MQPPVSPDELKLTLARPAPTRRGGLGPLDPTQEPQECSEDPVDLSNGTLRHAEADLVEPGPMPIRLERIYRQNDSNILYTFAMSTAAPWDMFLVDSGNPTAQNTIDLAIPGSHNVRFELVAGTTTLYKATDARGHFAGAFLESGGGHWLLTRDGTRRWFNFGRLERMWDRFGNETLYDCDIFGTANDLVTNAVSYPSGKVDPPGLPDGPVPGERDRRAGADGELHLRDPGDGCHAPEDGDGCEADRAAIPGQHAPTRGTPTPR